MIKSSLLWYEIFSTTFSDLGFKLNPYERCIANKIISENQCTTVWFVDNNKVSHIENSVNSMGKDNTEEKFGKLSCNTGKKHTFPGRDIEFIGGNKVALIIPHHIDEYL